MKIFPLRPMSNFDKLQNFLYIASISKKNDINALKKANFGMVKNINSVPSNIAPWSILLGKYYKDVLHKLIYK